MTAPTNEPDAARAAEEIGALVSGVLHSFAAIAVPVLLWDAEVVRRSNLMVFTTVEIVLAAVGFAGYLFGRRVSSAAFHRAAAGESLLAALNYAALPWLGPDIVAETHSKYLLTVTLVAITSFAATNSSVFEHRRILSVRTLVIVGSSHCLAYVVNGELTLAAFAAVWCVSIAVFSRLGHLAVRRLDEQRRQSDETARHDDLTDLLNRAAFMDALHAATTGSDATALVLLDLDGFKAINDGFGHAAGDAVLQTVALRLGEALPTDTALCRLGGDEFAALVSMRDVDLTRTIQQVLDRVGAPIEVDGRDLYVAGSVGWTELTPGGDAAVMLAEADAAMYRSKSSSTETSTGFDPNMRSELDRSLELRQHFRSAVRSGRIDFLGQPIVDARDRRPVAIELLARWPADDDVEIGTDEFNRLADETGLAVELDRLALGAAASLLEAWRDDPELRPIVVKANISPIHLHNLVLARSMRELIPGDDRVRLGLEFVEARMMDAGHRHHALLEELRDTGVILSIDDFGTGYSSLAYLRSLPVSEVKIDRSFVTGLDRDPVNRGLVRAIVDLATTLGLATVAEGVESETELATVTALGVGSVQGYAIAKPLPFDELADVLRAQRRAVADGDERSRP